ncbi:hypothetical protein GCM10010440_38100 [Kitasatospora cinereorecta]
MVERKVAVAVRDLPGQGLDLLAVAGAEGERLEPAGFVNQQRVPPSCGVVKGFLRRLEVNQCRPPRTAPDRDPLTGGPTGVPDRAIRRR